MMPDVSKELRTLLGFLTLIAELFYCFEAHYTDVFFVRVDYVLLFNNKCFVLNEKNVVNNTHRIALKQFSVQTKNVIKIKEMFLFLKKDTCIENVFKLYVFLRLKYDYLSILTKAEYVFTDTDKENFINEFKFLFLQFANKINCVNKNHSNLNKILQETKEIINKESDINFFKKIYENDDTKFFQSYFNTHIYIGEHDSLFNILSNEYGVSTNGYTKIKFSSDIMSHKPFVSLVEQLKSYLINKYSIHIHTQNNTYLDSFSKGELTLRQIYLFGQGYLNDNYKIDTDKYVLDLINKILPSALLYPTVQLSAGATKKLKKKVNPKSYVKTSRKFIDPKGVSRVVYTKNDKNYIKLKNSSTNTFYYRGLNS